MIGLRFNKLLVVGISHKVKGQEYWECRCDCGVTKAIRAYDIKIGRIVSCGCARRERMSKGRIKNNIILKEKPPSKLYYIWKKTLDKCSNPNNQVYKNFGGKGIRVCDRWLNFDNFLEDMGEPDVGMYLDRIDCNKDYSPENCKWSDNKEYIRNGKNAQISYLGKTQSLSAWARELGIKRITLLARLRLGWSVERTLTTPTRPIITPNKNKLE